MRVIVKPGYHVDTKLRKKPFYPGEEFDVDDKEGTRLIKAGVVKMAGEPVAESGGSANTLNVAKTCELVAAAQTIEELDKLADGESRKGVQTAIELRRKELTTAE
jgi:hypothetical protein